MRGGNYQLQFDREAVFSISGFLINGKAGANIGSQAGANIGSQAGANIGSQAGAWEPATAFSISISYLFIYANVGKGLPTYCVTRTVGRQPFAANDFKT